MTNVMHLSGLVIIGLFLQGCGSGPSDMPKIGTVRGTVTIDGQPANRVKVCFQPKDGGRPSTGVTDEQGHYDLIYSTSAMGAKVGKHTVSISNHFEVDPNHPNEMPSAEDGTVPQKYLTVMKEMDVEPGKNQIDLIFP